MRYGRPKHRRPEVFSLINPDGYSGWYVAVNDLDNADSRLLGQLLSPVTAYDEREYCNLVQLDEVFE